MRMLGLAVRLCLFLLGAVSALAADLDQDTPGASDLSGIPRYPGSVIVGFRASGPEETVIPKGPWDKKAAGGRGWKASVQVDGRRTRLVYLTPRDASAQEVIGHYGKVMKAQGYQTLFHCSGYAECGDAVEQFYVDKAHGKQLADSFLLQSVFSETSVRDPQILVGQRATDAGDVYVFVFAAYQDNFADSVAGDRVAVFVEQAQAVSGQGAASSQGGEAVQPPGGLLDAAGIAQTLEQAGRVALYDIRFELGKAEILPGSQPQLEALAQMLSQQADLEVYVVGHTDNRGTLDENLALSQRRAEAVVDALIRRYGIVGARLTPRGVASLAPVASNATEKGRAMNRRVELVAR